METLIEYILNNDTNSWRRHFREKYSMESKVFDYYCKYLKKIGVYHMLYNNAKEYTRELVSRDFFDALFAIPTRLVCSCYYGDFFYSFIYENVIKSYTHKFLDFQYDILCGKITIITKNKTILAAYDLSSLSDSSEVVAIAWIIFEALNALDLMMQNPIFKQEHHFGAWYNNISWMRLILQTVSPYLVKFDKTLYFQYFIPKPKTWKEKFKILWYYLRDIEPPIKMIE